VVNKQDVAMEDLTDRMHNGRDSKANRSEVTSTTHRDTTTDGYGHMEDDHGSIKSLKLHDDGP
jgi:hypothetical protein